jgi:hypothetical protein
LILIALVLVVGAASCGPAVEENRPKSPVQIADSGRTGPADEYDADWVESATLAEFAEETVGIEALGVYIGETKIGWAITERTLGEHEGRPAAIDTYEMQFAMMFMGARKETRVETRTIYSLEDGTILYAEQIQTEEQARIRIIALRRGDQMEIATHNLGRVQKRTVPLPEESLEQERELTIWLMRGPAEGESFETSTVAWDQLEVDDPLKYVFVEKKSTWWFGVPTDVYVLDLVNRGATTQVEVETDGSIIRGNMGPIELRAEDLSTVKRMEVSGIDLMVMIPLDRSLGDPTRVDSLTLELTGIEGFELPDTSRQSLERSGENTGVLRITREAPDAPSQPLAAGDRERFLAATPTHQADAPEIVELAREIVGDETDPVARADRLQQWVFSSLRKDSGADSATALNVLDRRAGDCTEHTMLFVALARAAGIPAREVGGIVYADLEPPSFGWHAWAEIHDGARWVSVDPTWNEVRVDATHIKLKQDDGDFSFVNLMGRLEVRVLAFESSP